MIRFSNCLQLFAVFCFFAIASAKPLIETPTCGYQSCNKIQPNALNVHVVSHSHDDVGWLKTVQQYYDGSNHNAQFANVSQIITSVVEALQKNPDRRFIQVESFFFHKWWLNQNEETKQIVHKLVENGQFEFTGGAWSMNDEAAADFHSIIDQFTLGLKFLNDTFGTCARPRIGWQIDPFGHSKEMASILAQMGFDGLFFPRIDFVDKSTRMQEGKMEVMWQGSHSLGDESNIFTSIMFNHYNAPIGFCFDVTCNDPDLQTDPQQPGYNYENKVNQFASVIMDGAKHYPTNNLLLPMGGDFNYMDADKYFGNLDSLIKGFSVFPQTYNDMPINIFYSTPACYVKAVNDVINSQNIELPKDVYDFFPYGTDSHSYWTGYFSSRPASKRSARRALNLLQIHKQLAAFTQASEPDQSFEMQNAVGIMQHHDAITGTEKQHVSDDYSRILHEAFLDSEAKINEHISKLLSKDPSKPVQLNLNLCLLSNVTICPDSSEPAEFAVVLYNPSSKPRKYPARIPVEFLDYQIKTLSGEKVNYQTVPSIVYEEEKSSRYEMTFIADLPPLGMKVYYINRANVVTFLLEESNSFDAKPFGGENSSFTLDPDTGLLNSVNINGVETKIHQELMFYNGMKGNGRNSGAYVFRNNGDAVQIRGDDVNVTTYKGDIFDEVHQVFSDWAKQVIRVYKDVDLANHIEFDWVVGPIPIDDKNGKEVISRFTSDLETGADFFTDANGRELIHRERDNRPNFKYTNTEPASGNYYPVGSEIAITDGNVRLAVLNDRAQGGSSLEPGQIELMVHRVTLRDDDWGVGEPLNEQESGVGVTVRGNHYLTLSNVEDENVERDLADKIAFAPWVLVNKGIRKKALQEELKTEFLGLNEELPEMVRVLTLEPIPEKKNIVLLRLENFYDSDEGKEQTVAVQNLFANFEILSLKEMNLAGNIEKQEINQKRLNWYNYNNENEENSSLEVTLKPMQIKTFIANVKYNN